MLYAVIGILIGVIIGLNITYTIPVEYIKYTAIAIIGILDALLRGIKGELRNEKRFNKTAFLSEILINLLVGLGLTLLGESLGLDLYIAVAVAFIIKIFKNVGLIRNELIKKLSKRNIKIF